MENFDNLCRSIDWDKMAKGRVSVKNLAQKKPSLRYIADFLDLLAETAVEVHHMPMSKIYPKSRLAGLVSEYKKREILDKITTSFFDAQDERRKKDEESKN
jgi:signal recognition particle subunit SEC65